jgi:hypothetical protein
MHADIRFAAGACLIDLGRVAKLDRKRRVGKDRLGLRGLARGSAERAGRARGGARLSGGFTAGVRRGGEILGASTALQ